MNGVNTLTDESQSKENRKRLPTPPQEMAVGASAPSNSTDEQTKPKPGATRPPLWERMFGIDLRTLALFRFCLGCLIFGDLVDRARDLEAHYTDFGVMPRWVVLNDYSLGFGHFGYPEWGRDVVTHAYGLHWVPINTAFPLAFLNGELWYAAFLFGLTAACAVALMLGWRTRWATVLCWYLLISIQTRNPVILNGADTALRLMAFWAIFLPLGARWSLDRRRLEQETGESKPLPVHAFSVATICIIVQICLLYWFTAYLKNDPVWRTEGTAVYFALKIEQYGTPFGIFLLSLPMPLLRLMNFTVLFVEGVGPFFAFVPWHRHLAKFRIVTILVFLAFHFMLWMSLDLGGFPFICSTAWVVFLPPEFWDWLSRRLAQRKAKNALHDSQTNNEQQTTNNAPYWRNFTLPQVPVKAGYLRQPAALQYAAGFFMLYAILWNLRSINYDGFKPLLPPESDVIAEWSRVDQYWALFAPNPMRDDGWYVTEGRLRDGREIDLFRRRGQPVDWRKPPLVSSDYHNERARKYMMNLYQSRTSGQRVFYARSVCRAWNRDHTGGDTLQTLRLYYIRKDTMPPGLPSTPRAEMLWNHNCFGNPGDPGATPPSDPPKVIPTH